MVEAAFRLGWRVEVTYARGTMPHRKHWTRLRVVDSVAVRMQRRAYRAVALYEDRAFAGGWFWRIIDLPRRVNHDELMEGLRDG